MKSKNIKSRKNYILILFVLCFCELEIYAQQGCDLCGPATTSGRNSATGMYSATIGAMCESRGSYSFAFGYYAKAYMTNTVAIGKFVKSQGTNSIVIGSGASNSESRMLTNNIPNSLAIGFNSALPTLFVSSSNGYNKTGKVAIGNVIPKSKLHIMSDNSEDAGIILESLSTSRSAFIQLYNENNVISVNPNVGMSIMSQGGNINFEANNVLMNAKLAINAPKDFSTGYNYALAVAGGILTNKVLVKEVEEWHDYVFDKDYELMPINKLKLFIDNNGHLPDMPSENSVLSKGYDMVEMDGLLLKKIEELTLYTIELNALINKQQEIIDSFKSE